MKRIFFILITLICVINSTSNANEKHFQYRITDSNKFSMGVIALGIGVFFTVNEDPQDRGVGLLTAVAGAASIAGNLLRDKSLIEISNKEKLSKTYKNYKALSKTTLSTGVIGTDKNYQKTIAENFECSWCSNDEDKVRKFSNMFIQLDSLAQKVVNENIFNELWPNEIFKESIVDKRISEILQEDDNTKNRDYINQVLAISITYHFINKK